MAKRKAAKVVVNEKLVARQQTESRARQRATKTVAPAQKLDLPIHFICGLRSGNTLLANFLGQHPDVFVTPTTGLSNPIAALRDGWWQNDAWKAWGLEQVKPRLLDSVKGLIAGFYSPEFNAGKVVIDKSRGWLPLVGVMKEALGRPLNLIVTIRDPRAVVASLEKKYRGSPWTTRDMGPNNPHTMALGQRVDQWLSPKGLVGLHFNALRNAAACHDESVLRVPYRLLTEQPVMVANAITEKLGLAPFDGWDPNNVEQITHEDDTVHGMDLHTIRQKIEPQQGSPWEGILPQGLADEIAKRNQDIVKWANGEP